MAGVYIHIPFCSQLCSYCDFHFSLSLSKMSEMVDAICCEMEMRKEYLQGDKITTLYIGGGTPSLLTTEQLDRLIRKAQHTFNFNTSELAEFTIECNPEDLTHNYLEGLKKLGCNRLSIGIQQFDNAILEYINRRHTGERAIKSIKDAQDVGFTNISIDLIFGIPTLSTQQLIESLSHAISLNIQHISAYHLTIEKKSVFGWMANNNKLEAIDESESEIQYSIVEKALTEAGFNHYEISNYALDGYESKHNRSYWRGTKYIGLGPSAHSYDGNSREWNINLNNRYINAITSGSRDYEREELSDTELFNEYIMTSLRCASGISIKYIRERWGEDSYNYLLNEAKEIDKIIIEDDVIRIDSADFLISDMIISKLLKV